MERYIYRDILINALKEDLGNGDLTTNICIADDSESEGLLIAKEPGILCGTKLVQETYNILDIEVNVEFNYQDGDTLAKGDIIGMIWGRTKSILSGERVALNFLQHLSGVATTTRKYVDMIGESDTKIVDTRKTTPGLRVLEKYAVTVGGGYNHRFGLFDGVMIKDNHIIGAGGIKKACDLARKSIPHTFKIEVEVSNLDEVEEALKCNADIIMLDNMSLEEMVKAVNLIDGRAIIEASGNMGDRNIGDIADIGVDIISIGSITNSVRNLDISLKFK
jgi:nicotinate-nucleotide pyrophosphorylase (carboxylating)